MKWPRLTDDWQLQLLVGQGPQNRMAAWQDDVRTLCVVVEGINCVLHFHRRRSRIIPLPPLHKPVCYAVPRSNTRFETWAMKNDVELSEGLSDVDVETKYVLDTSIHNIF